MQSLILTVSLSVVFSYCDLPANNKQRIEWLNDLVVRTQKIILGRKYISWISQGTLLGSVRDNQTIPWTGDADVHVFPNTTEQMCQYSSEIAQDFRRNNLIIYDCSDNFLRVCRANSSNSPPPIFADNGYAPEAKLELYGCVKQPDGLYNIKHNKCIWNFTGLFPLKKYHLGDGYYGLGPNQPIYWLEQYYGKDWRKPVVYSGALSLDNICVGKITQPDNSFFN